jgi:hypothetical protein
MDLNQNSLIDADKYKKLSEKYPFIRVLRNQNRKDLYYPYDISYGMFQLAITTKEMIYILSKYKVEGFIEISGGGITGKQLIKKITSL